MTRGVSHSGYALFATPLGACAVAWGEGGLRRIWLPEKNGDADSLRRRVVLEGGGLVERRPPPSVKMAIRRLADAVVGKPVRFDGIDVDYGKATDFQRAIYEALKATGPGETLSYGELAARAGRPGAARAVGQAMAKNPLPIVVPCHRVLGAGGAIGGFSSPGGTLTKAKLLAREGVTPSKGRPLPYETADAIRRLRRDRELAVLIDRVGPFTLRLQPRTSTFASLARAIIYQQLSGKAAATIHRRVAALFPHRRALHPEDIATAKDAKLRAAGLSRPKLAALRDLTARTLAGEIPSRRALDRMGDEDIVASLTAVRGIGVWTVEMLLMFQLGRPDVLPVGDLGIQNGFARAFGGERPSPETVRERGARWAPYRSAASWYLWRATEL